MTASELRIGNWVIFNNHLIKEQQVTFLKSNADLSEISPIPITEEWLIKLGFTHDQVFDKYFIYLPLDKYLLEKLSFRTNEGFICLDGIKYRTLLKTVTHVHQLQNLYFALSGQELTIQP